jgi:hypothetical protein
VAGAGGAPPAPVPVRAPGGGPLAWVAVGLLMAGLVALAGIALAGQSGGGSGSQVAVIGPTATAMATVTAAVAPGDHLAATPVATRSPTAAPTPPRGTPPPRVAVSVGPAATCPPGSAPDTPGPADQARPLGVSAMAFDRRAGRLVALAGLDDGVETWTFDVCTNTWTRMHPDREPPGVSILGQLVYDVDSGVTIASDSNLMWAYDLEADTWTEKGSFAPFAVPQRAGLRFYDPVSGLVVALGDDGDDSTVGLELWAYEVETDTWTPIPQAEPLAVGPHYEDFAYDASVDRLVAYANRWKPWDGDWHFEATTWLFDLRGGTWSGTGAAAPQFSYGWWGSQPAVAYDEAAERTVMVGQGHSAAYDATADRWETLYATPSGDGDVPGACGTRPECRLGRAMVYDAVNERLVVYGGQLPTTCAWETADDMWAFDMASRSWTLVVPPTPAPPPLRDLAADVAASTVPGRSPWIRPAAVTLHGGPFFTRVPGVADEPWSSTPPAAPATVADGLFVPDCQLWTDGTVWWEQPASDATSNAWIEIDLGGSFAIDSAVVQADANETYLLSYRDPETAEWRPLWSVPVGEAGGMATRPHQGDASIRWPLPRPVVTDALRFEATSDDDQHSASEIAVFGVPAP